MHGKQDGEHDLGASIIGVMEREWYAVLRDPPVQKTDALTGLKRFVPATTITIQCRVCPSAFHFDDADHEQVERAVAAFIAHAKKLHARILRDRRVNAEKL